MPIEDTMAPAESPDRQPMLEQLAQALEAAFRLCPELPVLAIRWMHLKHPLHEVQDRLLHEAEPGDRHGAEQTESGGWSISRWIRPLLLRRLVQSAVYAVSTSCRLAPLHVLLRREVAALKRQPFGVVAKTCCYWPTRPPADSDFYFGMLQQQLAQRGMQMLLVCGNELAGSWRAFARAHVGASPLARCPESALVPPFAPLVMLWKQLKTCARLRTIARQVHDPLLKRVVRLASQDCLAPNTARAGLYFWIGNTIASVWNPKALITLYEGNAWERCLFWGAKRAAPACQMVGYQHTAMFPSCLSQCAPPLSAREALPDVVLCLGGVTRALMQAGHQRYGARLIEFGSFRYRAPAIANAPDPSRRTVLVAPEGVLTEVAPLMRFAYACAKQMPSYRFILRCHPESPMAQVRRMLPADWGRLPNVTVSDGRSLEDDFARSSILLYRGSSTVMYAVLQGLLPLYLRVATLGDRDPLFRLSCWRKHCTTPEDFAERLAAYEQTPAEQREQEWRQAWRYAAEYTGPVTEDRITELLRAIEDAS